MNTWKARRKNTSSMMENGTFHFTYEIFRDDIPFFPEYTITCREDERVGIIIQKLNEWKIAHAAVEQIPEDETITV